MKTVHNINKFKTKTNTIMENLNFKTTINTMKKETTVLSGNSLKKSDIMLAIETIEQYANEKGLIINGSFEDLKNYAFDLSKLTLNQRKKIAKGIRRVHYKLNLKSA